MPRTALTVANTSRVQTGSPQTPVVLTEAAADASNFNSFANTGRELLILRNSGASTRTITFYDVNGVSLGSQNLAAGKSYVIGPFPVNLYGSTVNIDINHAEIMCVVAKLNHPGVLVSALS